MKNNKINSYIFNSWRGIKYNKKTKLANCCKEWLDYSIFYNDMIDSYTEGYILTRINKNELFSKENCKWMNRSDHIISKDTAIIEYNNELKSVAQWCKDLNIPIKGVRRRLRLYKKATGSEVLFGKVHKPKRKILSFNELNQRQIDDKISKMLSSYRGKDIKRNREFNLDREWFIDNILSANCIYCGTSKHVGCDRIDNNIGHIKTNIVPCCFRCNATRNNHFSFEEMKLIGETIKQIDLERCSVKQ